MNLLNMIILDERTAVAEVAHITYYVAIIAKSLIVTREKTLPDRLHFRRVYDVFEAIRDMSDLFHCAKPDRAIAADDEVEPSVCAALLIGGSCTSFGE